MKLIYFYLGKSKGINFNFGINLSENKFISINSHSQLEIKETKKTIPDNFYGRNIVNATAIVGRNGVGKSTFLNLLGLNRLDLQKVITYSSWLAIYEENENYFLEGFNADSILKKDETFSKFITRKLINNNNILELGDWTNVFDNFENNYCILHKPDFSDSYNNQSAIHIDDNDERNYGFKRNYINSSLSSFYNFVSKNNEYCSQINEKKLELKLRLNTRSLDDSNARFYAEIKRYLYLSFPLINKNKIERIKNIRKKFIINFIEEYILYVLPTKYLENESFLLNSIETYAGDLSDYDKIKSHLLKIVDLSLKEVEVYNNDLFNILDKNHLLETIKFLEKSDEIKFTIEINGFKEDITCSIRLANYDKNIENFIKNFESYHTPFYLKLPKMSSGEFDFNIKISGIIKAIELTINKNEDIHGFIILLDEYDEHLHPEWSRTYFNYLVKYLNEKYARYGFQLIFSTHSPYIISDLLKENVIKLEYNSLKDEYFSNKANRSFASNIYDIINDSFFLSQPIGEFAVNKIKNTLTAINKIKNVTPEHKIDEIRTVINSIDDTHIKNALQNQLDKKTPSIINKNEIFKINEKIDELLRLKEILENKLMDDSND